MLKFEKKICRQKVKENKKPYEITTLFVIPPFNFWTKIIDLHTIDYKCYANEGQPYLILFTSYTLKYEYNRCISSQQLPYMCSVKKPVAGAIYTLAHI